MRASAGVGGRRCGEPMCIRHLHKPARRGGQLGAWAASEVDAPDRIRSLGTAGAMVGAGQRVKVGGGERAAEVRSQKVGRGREPASAECGVAAGSAIRITVGPGTNECAEGGRAPLHWSDMKRDKRERRRASCWVLRGQRPGECWRRARRATTALGWGEQAGRHRRACRSATTASEWNGQQRATAAAAGTRGGARRRRRQEGGAARAAARGVVAAVAAATWQSIGEGRRGRGRRRSRGACLLSTEQAQQDQDC